MDIEEFDALLADATAKTQKPLIEE